MPNISDHKNKRDAETILETQGGVQHDKSITMQKVNKKPEKVIIEIIAEGKAGERGKTRGNTRRSS